MKADIQDRTCHAPVSKAKPSISLDVLPAPTTVRKSTMSRWRVLSLVLLHVLIIGHIAHWLIAGRTVSPVEPSETMYALNDGYINAGLIFFGLALLATLIFGRFVCGWGCHIVAYQDLCAWLLKKAGIKPKAFRSRLLVLAPLALALYMFVWPTAYRLYAGRPAPPTSNHLMTTEFWKTFPGPFIAILTFAVCGFVIVYFLGAKGFCTYACPYGGFFGFLDQFSPGKILVTDDCEHCGHCTAVCTSNVRVHEEVAKFGMVVDPGCMKCMDCVTVCPNEALYFGFAKPTFLGPREVPSTKFKGDPNPERKRRPDSIGNRQLAIGNSSKIDNRQSPTDNPKSRYDFALWEELVMAIVGLGSLLAYRGLYGQIPLLMAMGMAAITGYLFVKAIRLIRHANVRLQNLSLKRGGSITRWGWAYAAFVLMVLAFAGHSAAVQVETLRGHHYFEQAQIPDQVWFRANTWFRDASDETKADIETARIHLERVDGIGFFPTPAALQDLLWLHLARDDDVRAESIVRRMIALTPSNAGVHRGLAGVLRKAGRIAEAEQSYREAIKLDSTFKKARVDLAAMLVDAGRADDAIQVYQAGSREAPNDPQWPIALVRLLMSNGRMSEARTELSHIASDEIASPSTLAEIGVLELETGDFTSGIAHLRRALEQKPDITQVRYNLAIALLQNQQTSQAVEHLKRVVAEKPNFAEAHYNLSVGVFMSGDPLGAIPHVNESIRINPADPQAHEFLAMLHTTLGDTKAADASMQIARRLRGQ